MFIVALAFASILPAVTAHNTGYVVDAIYGTTPAIDGVVSNGEWDDARNVTIDMPSPGYRSTIYVKHDAAHYLFIAFNVPDATLVDISSDSINVLFDPLHQGDVYPQTDDIGLWVTRSGTIGESNGTGSEWQETSVSGWIAAVSSTSEGWQVELGIEFSKLGITSKIAKTIGAAFQVFDCLALIVNIETGEIMGRIMSFGSWPPEEAHYDPWNPSSWGDLNYGVPVIIIPPKEPLPVTVTFQVSGLGDDALGVVLTVEGTEYTFTQLPVSFIWEVGSTHTVAASDPVSAGSGKQYAWVSWSDGGGQTHSYTTPSSDETVTANYKSQYQLTMQVNPTGGGTTNPAVGTHWYDSGQTLSIQAFPTSGYTFSSWSGSGSGSYSGASNPADVTINGPITETANFQPTFNPPIRVSKNTYYSGYPSAAASGSYVYVAWEDWTPVSGSGGYPEIWLRVSSDYGANFGSPIRISTNTYNSVNPSVAAYGSYVYVAWEDFTPVSGSGSAPEIWMRISSNNGASFGSAIRISTNTYESCLPSVAASGSYVYVAWMDSTPVSGSGGSFEIWVRVSSNYGASFGPAIRISTNTGESAYPSVTVSGSYVYVAWMDSTPVSGSGGLPEIWMRVSSNNGGTFSPPIRISTNTYDSWHPSLAVSGSYVYVAWQDDTPVSGSGSQPEIWLRVGS